MSRRKEQQAETLAGKIIAARKAAEAAMPLPHGAHAGSEERSALILAAMVNAITGTGEVDYSEAPEFVPPEKGEDEGSDE